MARMRPQQKYQTFSPNMIDDDASCYIGTALEFQHLDQKILWHLYTLAVLGKIFLY